MRAVQKLASFVWKVFILFLLKMNKHNYDYFAFFYKEE